jgi:hypothetical protein
LSAFISAIASNTAPTSTLAAEGAGVGGALAGGGGTPGVEVGAAGAGCAFTAGCPEPGWKILFKILPKILIARLLAAIVATAAFIQTPCSFKRSGGTTGLDGG